MKRDRRLLAALVMLAVTVVASTIQMGVINAYIYAAVMQNWTGFPNPPPNGPDLYCLDYCVADLPFAAGWVAIASLSVGSLLVARSWWKPAK